jgi:transcriptional regulator
MESLEQSMASLPVIKGTLDVLALRALTTAPMHGFEIVEWLERAAGGSLNIEDSALYQALYRLEERGHLKASWGVTANNRKARYYEITPAGKAHLRAETKQWVQYAQVVTAILTGAAPQAQKA